MKDLSVGKSLRAKGLRPLEESKAEIRQEMSKIRNALSKTKRRALSRSIWKKLEALRQFELARTIMFYMTHRSEADTSEMIRKTLASGKRVVLPKIGPGKKGTMLPVRINSLKHDLERGFYGIFEPNLERCSIVNESEVDLVVVPALAFDFSGFRVGYGKGYYDRWLKKFSKKKSIGIAFDFQVREKLPRNSKDVPVGLVVTEKRVFRTY